MRSLPTAAAPQPVVIEKIVYVEKPAPAKKPRPNHLRTVSHAMSLPFFDMREVEVPPANEVRALVAEPSMLDTQERSWIRGMSWSSALCCIVALAVG